ncbi:cation transporter, putative [Leishmania panamensis]|uniref:Cation transporter, putative n=1 Tax=Leishmania panamensis TaxID=5679 RepID=A0A088RUY5_LEIPA|nr:cation transporter, putative [Leishmania panamensis]AIN99838.1 cation transporter, putative [Leishmania panamensis]
MSASHQRSGGTSVSEVEMTQRNSATMKSQSSPLLRGGDSTATTTMSAVGGGSAGKNTDGIRIRVRYLVEGVTDAAWRLVPNVATLKQMVCEQDQYFALPPSPTGDGDHFAKLPLQLPARTPATTNASPTVPSEPTADKTHGPFAFPAIRLSPTSTPNSDACPAWVSIKAATEEELAEVLESLPVHVLTRRRIISVLCADEDAEGLMELGNSESSSDEEDTESSSDGGREKDGRARRYTTVRDNFFEYFPAHGYAVLCLQAVGLQRMESTRCGAIQHDGMNRRGAQLPCTPVVALAFESALFTFSAGHFGGEGDVELIVANHAWVSESTRGTGGTGVWGLHSAASHLSTVGGLKGAESGKTETGDTPSVEWERQCDTSLPLDDAGSLFKDQVNGATPDVPRGSAAGRGVERAPLTYPAVAAVGAAPPPLSARQMRETQQAMAPFGSPSDPTSPNYRVNIAISVVCSSLVSAIIAYLQKSVRVLLIEADQLDELVLQILPSRVDQDDMLVRIKSLRHLIALFHIDSLQKERVLKELLLPAMRRTPLSRSTPAVERYQRLLSSIRSTILKLRKSRDIVNRASMTLISGVSARLLSHCHFMDYLNHVQTQITVIVMPVTIIPNLFAMNVRVPFTDAETTTPFFCIVIITLMLLLAGVSPILYKFLMYKTPGALATME